MGDHPRPNTRVIPLPKHLSNADIARFAPAGREPWPPNTATRVETTRRDPKESAYTSTGWFHDLALRAESMLFPRGKTKFIRPDGSIGRTPGHGVVLLGRGARASCALMTCRLGFCVLVRPDAQA
jgi:hypothetical protein